MTDTTNQAAQRPCPNAHPVTPHSQYRDETGTWYCPIERDAQMAAAGLLASAPVTEEEVIQEAAEVLLDHHAVPVLDGPEDDDGYPTPSAYVCEAPGCSWRTTDPTGLRWWSERAAHEAAAVVPVVERALAARATTPAGAADLAAVVERLDAEGLSGDASLLGPVSRLRAALAARAATPAPAGEETDGHEHQFHHFSRVVCACGVMHTYCAVSDCAATAEPCAAALSSGPRTEPDDAEIERLLRVGKHAYLFTRGTPLERVEATVRAVLAAGTTPTTTGES